MKTKLLVITSLLMSFINFAQNDEFNNLDLKLSTTNQEIMKKIVYPLKKGDTGPKVTYLQEVLLLVVEEHNMLSLNSNERPKVIHQLKVEKDKKEYGKITHYVVRLLQKFLDIPVAEATGEIDKKTANLFNKLVEKINENDLPQPDRKYIGRADTVNKAIKDAATKVVADQGPDVIINFIIKDIKGLYSDIDGFYQVEVVMETPQVTSSQLFGHVIEFQA